MNSQHAPIILIDGSSYLYRAFFASQQAALTTQAGFPTGAIRVMTSMLKGLLKQYPESPISVIFDAKGKTFRDELYQEYKANRPSMPDELRQQVEPIHQIIQAMGIQIFVEDGVEADDVIGTLAKEASEKNLSVIISTGDKDMAQLVNPWVTLLNTMTHVSLDRQGVIDKYGVPPELIIDLLALQGDKADNIPGVPGVGEKTALALLQGLGGISCIYAKLSQVAGLGFRGSKSIAAKLVAHEKEARLSYQLATIKTDVALHVSIADIQKPAPDADQLLALFQTYEFKSWVAELQTGATEIDSIGAGIDGGVGIGEKTQDTIEKNYVTVLEKAEFEQWLQKLQTADVIAIDTETTSLNSMQAQLVGLSFSVKVGEAAYIPLQHDYLGAPTQLDMTYVLQQVKPLLENPNKAKIGQHIKYDMNILANYGIQVQGVVADTMLESYVLNSVAGRHDMDSLAERFLNMRTTHFEDIAGKGKHQLTFNQIELEQAAVYAAEDADITLRLHLCMMQALDQLASLKHLFLTIEVPLIPVLAKMEQTGTLVSEKLLAQQSIEIEKRLLELQQQAYDMAGETFNLSSPKQLQEILYEKQGIPVKKKTPKGAPSTAEEVLQDLALDYPLPKVIIEHRGLSKLKSSYTDKLPKMINANTGRIHTSYHQANTATGRLSSAEPNLQNIPIRSPEGRRIRQAFIAPDGYQIVAADYSQIELRIMAHLSADEGLLKAFAKGADIHSVTASEVFHTPLDQVTTEQRRSAKAINFGLIYGMSAFGLARQLGLTRQQAQKYVDHYFATYPGVQHYMETTREIARKQGFVETLCGRRLYLPEINASNGMRRQAAERTAINAPMQGTAADIIKRAMIKIHHWLETSSINAKLLMQVHDELVFEVQDSEVEVASSHIKTLMESALDLSVPLIVEIGAGKNWDEAH